MKKTWTKNIKLLLVLILNIALIAGGTYASATYINDSVKENQTKEKEMGINSGVKGLRSGSSYSSLVSRLETLEAQDPYPVGSIYISINNTNPETIFGGEWEPFGTGKSLVAVDTSNTAYNAPEKTGGARTISYTPAGTNSGGSVGSHTLTTTELPSHTHNYVKATGVANTTLTVDQIPSHNHSFTGTAHTHPADNSNHGFLTITSGANVVLSTTARNGGSTGSGGHIVYLTNATYVSESSTYISEPTATGSTTTAGTVGNTGGGGAHTHTLNTSTVATEATGGGTGHSHTMTQPTFSGTAATLTVQDPYITVYMWKRIS